MTSAVGVPIILLVGGASLRAVDVAHGGAILPEVLRWIWPDRPKQG